MINPIAVRSLIALNKVAAGTHRLEIALDGSYRAVPLSESDESRLVTEAAIIRSSMYGQIGKLYHAWAEELSQTESRLRKHYGY